MKIGDIAYAGCRCGLCELRGIEFATNRLRHCGHSLYEKTGDESSPGDAPATTK